MVFGLGFVFMIFGMFASNLTDDFGDRVYIPYNRAVEMVSIDLVELWDIEEARRIQTEIWDELENEIRDISSGLWLENAINELANEFWEVEFWLQNANNARYVSRNEIEILMEMMIMGFAIGDASLAPDMAAALQGTVDRMIHLNQLGPAIINAEHRSQMILNEIEYLRYGFLTDIILRDNRERQREIRRTQQILRYMEEDLRNTRINLLRQTISTIGSIRSAIIITEERLSFQELTLERITTEYSFGVVSRVMKREAESAITRTRFDLNELRFAYQNGIILLNLILGEPLNQYTVIEIEKDFQEMPEDITMYAAVEVSDKPRIRILQIAVDRAEESYNTAGRANQNNRNNDEVRQRLEETRRTLQRAELELQQAKTEEEASIRQRYVELASLLPKFCSHFDTYSEESLKY